MNRVSTLVNWGLSSAFALVVAATGALAASKIPSAEAAEFQMESEALVAATAALFDDIEKNLAARADAEKKIQIRILGDAIPINVTTFDPAFSAFPPERGPVQHLTGYRITWYPVDRMLGVVDFMGTYAGNRNLVCGFVTWDMTNPEAPKLEHLSATYVDLGLLATRHAGATYEALLNANCAFGEIAPNFEQLSINR